MINQHYSQITILMEKVEFLIADFKPRKVKKKCKKAKKDILRNLKKNHKELALLLETTPMFIEPEEEDEHLEKLSEFEDDEFEGEDEDDWWKK